MNPSHGYNRNVWAFIFIFLYFNFQKKSQETLVEGHPSNPPSLLEKPPSRRFTVLDTEQSGTHLVKAFSVTVIT